MRPLLSTTERLWDEAAATTPPKMLPSPARGEELRTRVEHGSVAVAPPPGLVMSHLHQHIRSEEDLRAHSYSSSRDIPVGSPAAPLHAIQHRLRHATAASSYPRSSPLSSAIGSTPMLTGPLKHDQDHLLDLDRRIEALTEEAHQLRSENESLKARIAEQGKLIGASGNALLAAQKEALVADLDHERQEAVSFREEIVSLRQQLGSLAAYIQQQQQQPPHGSWGHPPPASQLRQPPLRPERSNNATGSAGPVAALSSSLSAAASSSPSSAVAGSLEHRLHVANLQIEMLTVELDKARRVQQKAAEIWLDRTATERELQLSDKVKALSQEVRDANKQVADLRWLLWSVSSPHAAAVMPPNVLSTIRRDIQSQKVESHRQQQRRDLPANITSERHEDTAPRLPLHVPSLAVTPRAATALTSPRSNAYSKPAPPQSTSWEDVAAAAAAGLERR